MPRCHQIALPRRRRVPPSAAPTPTRDRWHLGRAGTGLGKHGSTHIGFLHFFEAIWVAVPLLESVDGALGSSGGSIHSLDVDWFVTGSARDATVEEFRGNTGNAVFTHISTPNIRIIEFEISIVFFPSMLGGNSLKVSSR